LYQRIRRVGGGSHPALQFGNRLFELICVHKKRRAFGPPFE
jgi:hypothetical protein